MRMTYSLLLVWPPCPFTYLTARSSNLDSLLRRTRHSLLIFILLHPSCANRFLLQLPSPPATHFVVLAFDPCPSFLIRCHFLPMSSCIPIPWSLSPLHTLPLCLVHWCHNQSKNLVCSIDLFLHPTPVFSREVYRPRCGAYRWYCGRA